MSLDALLYASATSEVRRGSDGVWKFPGYLRDDEKQNESTEEGWFAPLDTGWIHRVRSFVTLGSPIDKYLTIWWLNYKYLLTPKGRPRQRKQPKIKHFNYCDELDPVGHNLDVVQDTPAYKALFECREDVVFNRYSVPGVAHNKYWTDQRLFRWLLHRAVDPDRGNAGEPPKQPRWFRRRAYWMLLFWLYVLVPVLVLLGTYASLSLALQADGWRSAALAAAVFAFLAYFGRRLIDLSIWWRQIQREKSSTFWTDRSPKNSYRKARRRAGTAFRVLVATLPIILAAQTTSAWQALTNQQSPGDFPLSWLALHGTWLSDGPEARLPLVGVLVAITILACSLRLRLPKAYRTPVRVFRETEAILTTAGCIAAGVVVALHPVPFPFPPVVPIPYSWPATLASFSAVATLISAYCLYRFLVVKSLLRPGRLQTIGFEDYAQ